MSKRIQRKRTKGWQMPEGAVYVGRPTAWGNPFRPSARATVVGVLDRYRFWLEGELLDRPRMLDPLKGRDLVCWCPLDQPCHADVLLELAR